MIHTHKLNRLSPDEMTVLLYCVNDGEIENPQIDRESLSWVKADYAFKMLNQYTSKLTDEKKKKQMQDISDKVTNP
jgi:hypothetical protein